MSTQPPPRPPDVAHAPAFDLLDCPLEGMRLVEASAGTGKTWTLCGLVLRLLLETPLELNRILVVTFTNAAAAELRDRVRSRIVEAQQVHAGRAEGDEFLGALLQRASATLGAEAVSQRLELALRSFDEAAIHTIHGFCQRALAEAPFSAGAPLATEPLDDDRELLAEVAQDFWRRRIAGAALDPALARWLVAREDSPVRFATILAQRIAKPLSRLVWPAEFDAAVPAADIAAWQAVHDEARELWRRARRQVLDIVAAAWDDLSRQHYRDGTLDAAAAAWDAALAVDDPLDLFKLPQEIDRLGSTRLKPKKGRPPLPPHAFFALADRWLEQRAACTSALELQRRALLRELLDKGPDALRALKAERRVVGFDDMLVNLHRRLHDDDGGLAGVLRRRFAAALIDEFQDTDPLQFAIVDRLWGGTGAPVFLVGDPKQAIYAFRNADLHTYLQARARAAARATLRHNQRSSAGLIDALNALFGGHARPFVLDGLDYVPVARGQRALAPFVDRSTEARAALQLWRLPTDADGCGLPKAQAAAQAAAACAGEIARLLRAARRGEVTIDGRALAAGDIAVLVRTHRHGAWMRDALAARGVGSVELSQASVFASADAAQLHAVLEAIADPTREPLLRAALATEAMGFDARAIDALADDAPALTAVLARFAEGQQAWLRHGIARALRQWVDGEGVARRLLARPDGERRMTNLLHLAELLLHAEHDHPSPQALLRWLQARIAAPRSGDDTQLRLESDRDLVQVVTIHRAKGLEYPLVFCPLLWDGHRGRPDSGPGGLEYHDDQGGPVIDFRILDSTEKAPLQRQLGVERLSEQLRLVYVALTRAVHRCHLVVGPYTNRTAHGTSDKESRSAALNWLVAGGGIDPVGWNVSGPPATGVAAAWDALAASHPGAIAIGALPEPSADRLDDLRPAPEDIAAREPPASIAPGWAMGSYSGLVHGARHEAAALDHDQRGPLPAAPDETPSCAADDILNFPRGPAAGDCLHALFEQVDFAAPADWPGTVQAVLQAHAAALPAAPDAPSWPRMLQRLLGDVLYTTLPGVGALAGVARARARAELEFHLPAHRLQPPALAALLRRHGLRVPTLAPRELSGYLRGFIDLVFEHDGRWFVLDWKSNHLGERAADYAPAALERTMGEQGYHLQALLYALALDRQLALRLAGYDYERHFGGVLYLFVRGVRPGWRDADGRPCGVHAARPSHALLEQLSALLEGHGAPA